MTVLRRLVLIGDVHTEATRLGHVLAHAAQARPDAVLCVGDIVDGPEDASRCIELLRDHGVETVRGNHERWLLDGSPLEPFEGPAWTKAWLAALPKTRTFETIAGRLLLGHGVGDHDMTRLTPDDEGYALDSNFALWELVADRDVAIYVGGHTHLRMARRFDQLLVLNPGTLARRDQPGFLEVDLEAGEGRWYRVGLDGVVADGTFALARVPRERGPAW
jgi:predicted phosphodiesterase